MSSEGVPRQAERESRRFVHFEYTNSAGHAVRCSEREAKELALSKPHYHPRRVVSESFPVPVEGEAEANGKEER